jgi:ParB-like chromosome segregation protein Spo0J
MGGREGRRRTDAEGETVKVETKTMDPIEIVGAEYNPRKRLKKGSKTYERLRTSIEEFGLVEPLVWNKRSVKQGWEKGAAGCLVGGHQRLNVIVDLNWPEVDVVVVDLDEDREKALNVALNRITGEWDNAMLAQVLTQIDSSEVEVGITGFDGAELDKLLAKAKIDDPEIVFTDELLEEHQYVVLYFDNTADWESAKEVLGIRTVHALDSRPGYERKGLGRVIRGAAVIKELIEARP